MNRTLHEADNAQRILKLTADTMLLVDRNGICIDIDIHSNLWFLQEERLLGKNIFERMPEHTREKVYSTFQTVLWNSEASARTTSWNWRIIPIISSVSCILTMTWCSANIGTSPSEAT